MQVYNDLQARGLIKQTTSPELEKRMSENALTFYCGFDPTSDSLHVGNLVPLTSLKRLQQAGHKVIAVVGGATGMIGDPSGKSQERQLLTPDLLKQNVAGITEVISKFLDLGGKNPALVVNNADWFQPITFIDFLRDVGKHFTVNHMLAKESVRARLEDRDHGISYTEFSYMLLQAYDFYHLHRDYGCQVQIGGSDQWGNITAGIELIRRIVAAENASTVLTPEQTTEHAFGFTMPLVQKADGTKFGKSESGAIWMSAHKTSVYDFYQYFIQAADADVIGFLNFFTMLDAAERARLEESLRAAPEKREAQKVLARELTRLVHGDDELARVEKASQALFSEEIKQLDEKSLSDVFAGAPVHEMSLQKLISQQITLIEALVASGLCPSNGAAKKEIQGGGIYINNVRASLDSVLHPELCLIAGKFTVLRRGKKTYQLLKFS